MLETFLAALTYRFNILDTTLCIEIRGTLLSKLKVRLKVAKLLEEEKKEEQENRRLLTTMVDIVSTEPFFDKLQLKS